MHECTGGWLDGRMDGWGWVDGWMHAWVDGWMDGWMHGWLVGCICAYERLMVHTYYMHVCHYMYIYSHDV